MSATPATKEGSQDASRVAVEALMRCPICASARFEFWLHGRDRLHNVTLQAFDYSRCQDCDVVFQSLRPVEAEIGRFYADDYAPHGDRRINRGRLARAGNRVALKVIDMMIGRGRFVRELNTFYAQLSTRPRVLDYGCGAGSFLDRAKRHGCDTIGVDFSPAVLERVAQRGHRALSPRDKDWALIEDGSIGFVRLNHVIEHLYQPHDMLNRLYAKMAPGAHLHVATPNPDGWSAKLFGDCWWGLECPRHIILFPPKNLTSIIESAGFVDIRVIQEPLTKDIARSFAYRAIEKGTMPPQNVGALEDDAWLNMRFVQSARCALRQGRGDRIHLLARRANS